MVLAEAPHHQEAITLLVDVGTNAEIVLGNRDRLLAASSPTGPAFEGAQISSGQRAAPGAVERVRIDPKTLEPRFRVIDPNAGLMMSPLQKKQKDRSDRYLWIRDHRGHCRTLSMRNHLTGRIV